MVKFPHDYLQSDYKNDIQIIFRLRDTYTWITLRYQEMCKTVETSQAIVKENAIETYIHDLERALIEKIKKEVK